MFRSKTKISLIRNIRRYVFYILISLLAIISSFIIIDRLIFIKNTKDRIYTETLNRESKLIKSEILTVSNMIYHYIEHSYDRNELLKYLRKIRFGEKQDGYIFVNTYEGTVIILDTQKELEGKNIWNMEDPNGIKVIQDERKAVENPDGDFIYYSWEQPSTGKITPKISFIIGIPEWEWMIGTGVYLDSIETETAFQVKQIYKNLLFRLIAFLFIMIFIFMFIYLKFNKFTISVTKDISFINNCFKKAEKEKHFTEIKLKLQREQSPLAYVGWDFNYKIIEWNPAAETIFGYTKEEALGQGFELIIPDHETTGVEDLFYNLVKTDNRKKNINQNITKDGNIITCEWYNNNLIDSNGDNLGIVAIGFDITRRLESLEELSKKNNELEKSLKEKRILIREVHHRVKNNMAIISSLLSLQSSSIKDEFLQSLLQSSQNRIQSMAMIHEHIYKNEMLHDINVRVYLNELIEYLMISFGRVDHQVELNIKITNINLDLDTLIPMGMLVNEIVSNSFKYAYRSEKLNELTLILQIIDENKYYLYIADNGPGFEPENNSIREGSIGLSLIQGLVEQIDGRLIITTEGKTAYEIYF